MKKNILQFILLFVITGQILSCQTVKSTITDKSISEQDNFIPFLLPIDTEQALYDEIKTLFSDKVKLGVTFQFTSTGAIDVYINVFRKGYDRGHTLTNRKIFINDTFYPLVFEVDDTFFAVAKGGFPIWNVSRTDPENKRNDIVTEEKIPSLEERKKLRAIYQRSNVINHNTPIFQIDLEGNIINQ